MIKHPPEKKDVDYSQLIVQIKENIRFSRYKAAQNANKEMVWLYFNIGKILSRQIKELDWGSHVLNQISKEIQREFPGIRGFSARNIEKMKQFYEGYHFLEIENSEIVSIKSTEKEGQKGPTVLAQLHTTKKEQQNPSTLLTELHTTEEKQQIPPSVTAKIYSTKQEQQFFSVFFQLGFSHHMLVLHKCNSFDERYFYINKAVKNKWTYRFLQYHIESNLYEQQGKMQSNFEKTLPDTINKDDIGFFKDEYLLNFINIRDDEKELVLEQKIVNHIKEFMLSFGSYISFIGNQYRLLVGEDEFFIDLLFYHRKLKSLIAIDLKRGKFKPEYAGKMNFYLTALDKQIKLPDENPSIGIILCQEKNNLVVEYSVYNINKPLGIATYRFKSTLPDEIKHYLPAPEEFRRVLGEK